MIISNLSSTREKAIALRVIKDIEKQGYPDEMQQIQDCEDWKDLQAYAESNEVVLYITKNTTYVIATDDEVVDWCGRGKDVFSCLGFMANHFNGKAFRVDLRGSTSFRVAKSLQKRGRLTILESNKWTWSRSCPEVMYNCLCLFTQRSIRENL